jgi:octaprenyl-diphosphate synthase
MSSPLVGAAPLATESADLEAELEQVRELLIGSLDGLYPPLSTLARAAVRDAMPLRRAALVLAVAVADERAPQEGTPEHLRDRRILLAAALEMLHVALSIHSHLLGRNSGDLDQTLDKSIVGSTILTGDYCFSRAASLAAQTESPVVVDLFAQALKTVSEGMLRRQMQPADAHRPATLELCLASVDAAAHLAALSPTARAETLRLAPLFAGTPDEESATDASNAPAAISDDPLSPRQALRREAALAWLAALPPGR